MKILQTPARFHPSVGGVENYVYNLSRELVNLGHEVTVLCADAGGNTGNVVEGVKVKRLGYVGKIANTNITLNLPLELLKSNFDVIHTHLPTPWSADWSALASKMKDTPLVLTYHNDIIGCGMSSHIAGVYNKSVLGFVLRRAEKIIITQPRYMESSPHLGRYKNKITVIPNGVDIQRFKPIEVDKPGNTLSFLSILDQYHEYKGLNYLLRALKMVREEIPDIKLRVGGGGELIDSYREMAASLGLNDNVEFLGFIPEENLVEFYNESNIFILPSISPTQEGFGIVLLEALACGKPVIATNIVGIAGEIKGVNAGIIVKIRDEKSLAESIIRIMQDKELAGKMGINGRRLVEEKYSWMRIAKMMEEVYESI